MAIAELLLALLAIFAAAKLFGELAERIGQPAVLGEMVGGIVIGVSGLRLIDPHDPLLHLLSQLGVVLLLFLIGLETNSSVCSPLAAPPCQWRLPASSFLSRPDRALESCSAIQRPSRSSSAPR